MSDSVYTYLLTLENFGKYANEDKARQFIERYLTQICSDRELFLQTFPQGTRVGNLIREYLTPPADLV